MFRGRLDFIGYCLGYLYSYVPLVGYFFLLDFLTNYTSSENWLRTLQMPLLYLAIIYLLFCFAASFGITVRRMHDFNIAGKEYFWSIYPYWRSGDAGKNDYGDPQHPRGYFQVMLGTGQNKNRS